MLNVAFSANKSNKQSGDNIRKSFNTAFSNISKFTDKVAKNVKKDLLDINDDAIGKIIIFYINFYIPLSFSSRSVTIFYFWTNMLYSFWHCVFNNVYPYLVVMAFSLWDALHFVAGSLSHLVHTLQISLFGCNCLSLWDVLHFVADSQSQLVPRCVNLGFCANYFSGFI